MSCLTLFAYPLLRVIAKSKDANPNGCVRNHTRQFEAVKHLVASNRYIRCLLNQLATYNFARTPRGSPNNHRYDYRFRTEVLRVVRDKAFDTTL